jgi:hypothetical protein
MIEFGDLLRVGEVFGRDVEGVEVAGGGVAEQDRRVVLLSLQCGQAACPASKAIPLAACSSVPVRRFQQMRSGRPCGRRP